MMKLIQIYILLLLITLVCCNVKKQQKPTKKKSKGKSKFKPTLTIRKHQKNSDEDDKKQIQCLVCSVEFVAMDFDSENNCYNPGLNSTLTKQFLLSTCPTESKYCVTEITRIHGVFSAIQRRCGEVFCVEACFNKGFGIDKESCRYCCDGVKPFHFQSLEEFMNENLNQLNEVQSNLTQNEIETQKMLKEFKLKAQKESMLSSYNCPQVFKNEF